MISLDLSQVTENSTLISALMTCSSAWMEAALLTPPVGSAGASTTKPGAS